MTASVRGGREEEGWVGEGKRVYKIDGEERYKRLPKVGEKVWKEKVDGVEGDRKGD